MSTPGGRFPAHGDVAVTATVPKETAAARAGAPASCPIRDVLDRVGDKWSMLLLLTLDRAPSRFNALSRAVPDISRRMLAETLRSLQRDGLVWRRVEPTTPPSVSYGLTPLGSALVAQMRPLVAWADRHHALINEARARFDAASDQ